MVFNWQGLVLAIICLGVMGVEVAVTKWIRKVTNTYWFWLGWAVFYLIYNIIMVWALNWNTYAHIILPTTTPLTENQCSIVSNALFLNMCPMFCLVLPATLIIDPTRKAAKTLAPIVMIASLAVILLELPTIPTAELSWRYIFVGTSERRNCHFWGHAMNLFMAFGVILNTPKFGWKGSLWTYFSLSIFYIYVLIISRATGCTMSVSGLHLNEFGENGTYKIFASILPNVSLGGRAAIFFPGLFILIFGEIILIDISKKGYISYGDKVSGCWWKYYDYNKITEKEPWGWFSHQWQLKHPKKNIKLKLNKK